ncbi:aldo/keto reductase [Patescibacteria group bacterium]
MKYKIPYKKTDKFKLPVLSIGTWEMGGRYSADSSHNDNQDIQAIKRALELGITHIDTAEIYANGHAEELVAEAIKEYNRSDLFITSKVPAPHQGYDDLIKSAQASIKRLNTNYIDLYLLHSPSAVPLKESMKAMDTLVENELIKHYGVSNFIISDLEEALSHSKYGVVNNQIHVSLTARAYEEKGVLEFCTKHNILVSAFRPLDKGKLPNASDKLMEEMKEKYSRPASQIALRWIIQQPNMVAIFKAAQIDHLEEDLGALEWKLDKSDVRILTDEYPTGKTFIYN